MMQEYLVACRPHSLFSTVLGYGTSACKAGGIVDEPQNPGGTLTIPLIASSYTLGCLAMVLFLTFTGLGHRYGRRMSILVGDVFVIVGGVIQAASYCSTRLSPTALIHR